MHSNVQISIYWIATPSDGYGGAQHCFCWILKIIDYVIEITNI